MIAGADGSTPRVLPDPSMSVVVNAAAPQHPVTDRPIVSRILGDIAVPSTSIYTFTEGLHGFESEREFALVPAARDGFWWLQSTTQPQLAFLLLDPFQVHAGYEVDLRPGDIRFLELESPEEAVALTVVTLPESSEGTATTNLRGPLVFNHRAQLGRQVVSAVEGHALQVRIALAP